MTADPPSRQEPDLYAALAPLLADDGQRAVLRALLDRLADGGGLAVREEVGRRLRASTGEEARDPA